MAPPTIAIAEMDRIAGSYHASQDPVHGLPGSLPAPRAVTTAADIYAMSKQRSGVSRPQTSASNGPSSSSQQQPHVTSRSAQLRAAAAQPLPAAEPVVQPVPAPVRRQQPPPPPPARRLQEVGQVDEATRLIKYTAALNATQCFHEKLRGDKASSMRLDVLHSISRDLRVGKNVAALAMFDVDTDCFCDDDIISLIAKEMMMYKNSAAKRNPWTTEETVAVLVNAVKYNAWPDLVSSLEATLRKSATFLDMCKKLHHEAIERGICAGIPVAPGKRGTMLMVLDDKKPECFSPSDVMNFVALCLVQAVRENMPDHDDAADDAAAQHMGNVRV